MDEEKLIEAVRTRPFIYTKRDRNHWKRDLVSTAWDDIAKEVGGDVTVADCKRRWASLRDHFKKRHRQLSAAVSEQEAAKKRRKWYLYNYLTFLTPSCSTRVTSSNLPQLKEGEDESSGDKSQGTQNSTLPPSDDESSQPDVPPRQCKKAPTRCSLKKKDDTSAIDREITKAFREAEKEPVDENELFFKSLLPVMKTLNVMQALELRGEIQRLVISFVRATKRSGTPAPQISPLQASTSSLSSADAAHQEFQHSTHVPFYRQDQDLMQRSYTR